MNAQQYHAYGTVPVEGVRVLALAPASSDLAAGCGGALARHHRAGDSVTVLLYGGISPENRRFDAITAALSTHRPARVYLPSALEAPDTVRLVRTALARLDHPCDIWLYETCEMLRPNRLVSIDAVLDEKRAACTQSGSPGMWEDVSIYRSLCAEKGVVRAEAFFVLHHPQDVAWPEQALLDHLRQADGLRIARARRAVSIVIRTRNRPRFLAEALESCAQQECAPHEVVVVNDAGDDVAAVLAPFRERMPIVYENLARNVGRAAAGNIGWKAASGTHIVFFDDDDLLLPDHLAALSAASFLAPQCIPYTGTEIRTIRRHPDGREEILHSGTFMNSGVNAYIRFENRLTFMSALIPKASLLAIGGIDESFRSYEDWDLWIRLANRHQFRLVPQVTSVYRLYQQEGLGATFEKPVPEALRQLYEKHRAEIPLSAWRAWRHFRMDAVPMALMRDIARETLQSHILERQLVIVRAEENRLGWRLVQWLRRHLRR